jgi:glyoxylase-like metal-dependent hydrolase (beta-lactamase superfamily II)
VQVEAQIQLFEMDEEPIPGVMPVPTPWHTAGHVAFAFADGNDTLLFTGDALTHKILAIENPWMRFLADWMPDTGPAGRYELLDVAVSERWKLLCCHAAFPGMLYVDHQGQNFQATAATYKGSVDALSVCA